MLVAGGDNCSGVALASWDLWSAEGIVSSTAANQLSEARASLTATAIADGTVLLAGGGSKTAELFKAADLSVTKLPSMLAARSGHTATLLPTGEVLITGDDVQQLTDILAHRQPDTGAEDA